MARLEGSSWRSSDDRAIDRRARAEALAEGLVMLRKAVDRGVLA